MDPQIQPDYVSKLLPSTLSLIITSIICVFIGVYLEKFKSRLTFLKYKMLFQPLATASQNNYWGNVQVLYNGRETSHLNFITIEITNDSNRDFQDLNIDIWVDPESQILGQSGKYKETGTAILLEKNYYSLFKAVLDRFNEEESKKQADPNYQTPIQPIQIENEQTWVLTNKKFNLPVLNRHSTIIVNLLVENFQARVPNVAVSILHKSIKLIKQEDEDSNTRKLLQNMIIWGLSFFSIGFFIIIKNYSQATLPIVLTGILGLTYSLFGILIYKIIKFVRQYLT